MSRDVTTRVGLEQREREVPRVDTHGLDPIWILLTLARDECPLDGFDTLDPMCNDQRLALSVREFVLCPLGQWYPYACPAGSRRSMRSDDTRDRTR